MSAPFKDSLALGAVAVHAILDSLRAPLDTSPQPAAFGVYWGQKERKRKKEIDKEQCPVIFTTLTFYLLNSPVRGTAS